MCLLFVYKETPCISVLRSRGRLLNNNRGRLLGNKARLFLSRGGLLNGLVVSRLVVFFRFWDGGYVIRGE